jgi:lysophospholipase L1-like esterase
MWQKQIMVLFLGLVIFQGCSDSTGSDNKKLDFNSLDFSKTIFLGNSLTAGFGDGGLVEDIQEQGWAMQLADHFEVSINYPVVANPGLSSSLNAEGTDIAGVLELIDFAPTIAPRGYTPFGNPFTGHGLIGNLGEAYTNLGVPGALCGEVLSVTGGANSFAAQAGSTPNIFFDYVLQNSGKSVLATALEKNPTFAFVWLGNNDVLGYATSGGTTPIDLGSLLGDFGFISSYNAVMTQLGDAGLGGNMIVMNIPDVTSIPYFTTITPVQGTDRLVGNDDSEGTREITDNELVCLTGSAFLAEFPGTPLPDEYWLTQNEITIVETKTSEFNTHIANNQSTYDYVLLDLNSFFNQVAASGYDGGDRIYTTDFITGGLFSLDGIHPTPQGYKIVANKVIEKLNSDFGTDISTIN